MDRRSFLKCLGAVAVVLAVPASVKAALATTKEDSPQLDEWHRIFVDELKPYELMRFEIFDRELGFGKYLRCMVKDGADLRYVATVVDVIEIEQSYYAEDFIRHLARKSKRCLQEGFRK